MDQELPEQRRGDGHTLWALCGFMVGLILGVMLMWWGLHVYQDRTRAETIYRLNDQLVGMQQDFDQLQVERNVLEGRLAVESSTRRGLESSLSAAQRDLGAARDQIAFFTELLPPGPDGSISVRGLDVQQKGRLLQFRVLLMRHGATDEAFEGMLQFQATGQVNGEAVTSILQPARNRDNDQIDSSPELPGNPPLNSGLTLQFDQFQRSSGLLQIPEGMTIDSVTLNVLEGEALRVSRTLEIDAQPVVR